MLKTIYEEMLKGNFSFSILLVGVLQLVFIILNGKSGKDK